MTWRLAGLRKNMEIAQEMNYVLEVVVADVYFKTQREAAAGINKLGNDGTSDRQRMFIGLVTFQDSGSQVTREILEEFVSSHPGHLDMKRDTVYDAGYVTYGQQFEATLPTAFVTYFSKRQ